MPARLRVLLAHRRLPLILAAAALLLCAPALFIGRVLDDMFMRLVMDGQARAIGLAATPDDLFRFCDGDPARGAHLIRQGALPWFADPSIKLAFLRPIASALHRLDYALFPSSPAAMHAHSLLWLALLVLLVARLHRRFAAEPWVVGLGAAFFALDDAHGVPVAWTANRNALVAVSFGVAALHAYDRGRRDGARASAIAGPLLFLLALSSGEAAIGMSGYFVAHALLVDRAPVRARLRALAPYALALIAFAATYRALGYGARGSTLYVDPARTPGRFVAALLERLPALAAGALTPLSSDFSVLLRAPLARAGWVALCVLAVAPIVALAWPVLRRDRAAAFFATGAALSLVPVAATFPNDRLTLACGVGLSAALARVVAWARGAIVVEGAPSPSRRAAWLGGALLIVHGVVAPLQLPMKVWSMKLSGRVAEAASYPPALLEGRQVVVVSAPSLFGCTYVPMVMRERGLRLPASMACLASSAEHVDVLRDGEASIVLRPARGFGRPLFDELYRSDEHHLRVGDRFALGGCVLEVIELDEAGRPTAARATFEGRVDDPARSFVIWTARGLEPFALPPVGGSVRVPGVAMETLLFGAR